MASVMLLLGSNIGKKKHNLQTACHMLEEHGIRIQNQSLMYRTRPVGYTDQPDFLNQALKVVTELKPRRLLQTIKRIESTMGRDTTVRRWGPRLIDIDILFYDRTRIEEPDLHIPHAEFFNRPFAQIMAAELSPDFVPPGKKKRCAKLPGE